MFSRRRERDVERLAGRRGDKEQRAVLWNQIDAVAEKVAEKLAGTRFGVALGPYIRAASIDENELDALLNDNPTIGEINQTIDAATTFIDNLTADYAETLPTLDEAIGQTLTDANAAADAARADAHAAADAARADALAAADAARADALAALQDSEGILLNDISRIIASLTSSGAQITTEQIARADGDSALAFEITTLEATVDGVSATLTNNYLTAVETDSAISSATTLLESSLQTDISTAADAAEAGAVSTVNATLTNDYLTAVETDSAISALETSLSADIDGVSADLSANYYTVTENDSAISAIQTELLSIVGNITAGLTSEQTARANEDAAIATNVTALTARMGDAEADITTEQTVRSDADNALATDISTVAASLAATDASVTQNASAVATIEGFQAATYSLRVIAGQAEGLLEIVAADDPINGPVSQLQIDVSQVNIAGRVNADWISSGFIRADLMQVDDLLRLDTSTAGFSMEKTSPYDQSIDGVYMGRTQELDGSVGFGLSVQKTDDVSGLPQTFEATKQNGLRLFNANFFRTFSVTQNAITYDTSGTYDLLAFSGLINVFLVGGGAGGNAGMNGGAGTDGGDTTVTLKDGSTVIETWVATGGVNDPPFASDYSTGVNGASTQWGLGGAGGDAAYYTTVQSGEDNTRQVWWAGTAGGDAVGYGAGGGGGGARDPGWSGGKGGARSETITTLQYDISGLADPKIEVTIGAKGTGGSGLQPGGDGQTGAVRIGAATDVDSRADVIPLAPTHQGTMAIEGPFPDLGSGLWVIPGSGQIGEIEIDSAGTLLDLATGMSFVSAKTPVITTPSGTTGTTEYLFHKMG